MLRRKAEQVRLAGSELAAFSDREPFLASECGVEISALEAKTILGSGTVDRVISAAAGGEQYGRGFTVSRGDLEAVHRLEGVLSLASSRIAQKYMALQGQADGSAAHSLGSAISLVSGVVGLVKSIF